VRERACVCVCVPTTCCLHIPSREQVAEAQQEAQRLEAELARTEASCRDMEGDQVAHDTEMVGVTCACVCARAFQRTRSPSKSMQKRGSWSCLCVCGCGWASCRDLEAGLSGARHGNGGWLSVAAKKLPVASRVCGCVGCRDLEGD
jgi:hypothetical protein